MARKYTKKSEYWKAGVSSLSQLKSSRGGGTADTPDLKSSGEIRASSTLALGSLPFYNPNLHKAGDLVKHWVDGRLVEFIVPELDLDGNPLEPSNIGRLTVKPNYKKPKFNPMPKSIKRGKRK